MAQNRGVGVVNGGKQAICSTLEVHIEYRVYGRNNEIKALQDVKEYLKTNFNKEVPEGFSDRELLKFVQANFFDL